MNWKEKARQLESEIKVLYLAFKDPRTPWYAKTFMAFIIAYAVSPIDLVPDLIPVLGYVDDLILIPAGIYLSVKMVPQEVMAENRQKARSVLIFGKSRWIAATIIILIWLLVIYWMIRIILF